MGTLPIRDFKTLLVLEELRIHVIQPVEFGKNLKKDSSKAVSNFKFTVFRVKMGNLLLTSSWTPQIASCRRLSAWSQCDMYILRNTALEGKAEKNIEC